MPLDVVFVQCLRRILLQALRLPLNLTVRLFLHVHRKLHDEGQLCFIRLLVFRSVFPHLSFGRFEAQLQSFFAFPLNLKLRSSWLQDIYGSDVGCKVGASRRKGTHFFLHTSGQKNKTLRLL